MTKYEGGPKMYSRNQSLQLLQLLVQQRLILFRVVRVTTWRCMHLRAGGGYAWGVTWTGKCVRETKTCESDTVRLVIGSIVMVKMSSLLLINFVLRRPAPVLSKWSLFGFAPRFQRCNTIFLIDQ